MKIRDSYRIVVMGDGCVGKTSIVTQFIQGNFYSEYKPTVEDFHTHNVRLKNGYDHNIQILDTAGAHKFPAMRELSIRTGRGFILVFSLDSKSSFNETVYLYELIVKTRGSTDIPIVLVGNKSDLKNSSTLINKEMIINRKRMDMNDIVYIETSAKDNINIYKAFQELLILALNQENRLEKLRKLQHQQEQQQAKKIRNQQFLSRLSTFGSLPNINLIRRKSSSNQNNNLVNNFSNCSINSDCSNKDETSSSSNDELSSKQLAKRNITSSNKLSKSSNNKPLFYSPIIRRKFNDNFVKPQLSLDETKLRFNRGFRLNKFGYHQKICITKSFDTASTTSNCSSNSSNGSFSGSENSNNSSIKGSKESLERKCNVF